MEDRLSVQDLAALLAAKNNMTKKDAEIFVKEFFLLIEEGLSADRYVKIKGLGTFKLIDVDSRESVKVSTGERFEIKSHTKISFTPETSLRDAINKPFAHFNTVLLNDEAGLDDVPLEETEDEEPDDADESTSEVSLRDNQPEVADETPVNEILPVLPDDGVPASELSGEKIIHMEMPEKSVSCETEKADAKDDKDKEEEPEIIKPMAAASAASSKSNKTLYVIIVLLIFLLLCCAGVVLYLYLGMSEKPVQNPRPVESSAVTPAPAVKDTLPGTIDTTRTATVTESAPATQSQHAATESSETKQEAPKTAYSDSVGYEIVGTQTTHTLKEGETLRRVSLRFYGTKELWNYILRHNRDIISNPDVVPCGTVLKIPQLKAVGE